MSIKIKTLTMLAPENVRDVVLSTRYFVTVLFNTWYIICSIRLYWLFAKPMFGYHKPTQSTYYDALVPDVHIAGLYSVCMQSEYCNYRRNCKSTAVDINRQRSNTLSRRKIEDSPAEEALHEMKPIEWDCTAAEQHHATLLYIIFLHQLSSI